MTSERWSRGEPVDVWVEVQQSDEGGWEWRVFVRRRKTIPPPPGHGPEAAHTSEHVEKWGSAWRPTRRWAQRCARRDLRQAHRILAREARHEVIR